MLLISDGIGDHLVHPNILSQGNVLQWGHGQHPELSYIFSHMLVEEKASMICYLGKDCPALAKSVRLSVSALSAVGLTVRLGT